MINGHNKLIQKYDNYILIDHVNGLIDDINIIKIIHSKTSYDLFPACKDYIFHTGTTSKYSNTIQSKVTNYINTVNNINWNNQCSCRNYQEFIDPHHVFSARKKHILDKTSDILNKCINTHSTRNVLNKKVNMDYMKEFHNQFVPVDKAAKT